MTVTSPASNTARVAGSRRVSWTAVNSFASTVVGAIRKAHATSSASQQFPDGSCSESRV